MSRERQPLPQARETEIAKAKEILGYDPWVYRLGDEYSGLPQAYANIVMLDPGPNGHYGPVFAHIIEELEINHRVVKVDGKTQPIPISPETTVLVETSTGNAKNTFVRAADYLGYECVVVMPFGMPEERYRLPEQDYKQGQPEVIRADSDDYALGMTKKLRALLATNPDRVARGEKPYYCLNHAVSAADTTVRVMSELGKQMVKKVRKQYDRPIGGVVVTMGNGASVCALGIPAKEADPLTLVIGTGPFASGNIYDLFAQKWGLQTYEDRYGMKPGTLMDVFNGWGSSAPFMPLPLQIYAITHCVDDWGLYINDEATKAYRDKIPKPSDGQRALVGNLPKVSMLPSVLRKIYGNTTIGNIVIAKECQRILPEGTEIVAMAYERQVK